MTGKEIESSISCLLEERIELGFSMNIAMFAAVSARIVEIET